jgi:hypothetical protein
MLPESWEQVRGIQMIMVLKILSVSSDASTRQLKSPPPFVDYLGYIFCPANVAFGPWVPFSVYMRLFEPRKLVIYKLNESKSQVNYVSNICCD